MTCQDVRELLGAYADDELPRQTADPVADHPTTCAAGAAELETTMRAIADVGDTVSAR